MTGRTGFVRTASARDLPAISALVMRAGSRSECATTERLASQLDAPQSEFVVADDGAEIIGAGYAAMEGEHTVRLVHLSVDPIARGVGNGRAMLVDLLEAFPTARSMILDLSATNETAIAFFAAHGFVEADSDERDGITTLTMRRELD